MPCAASSGRREFFSVPAKVESDMVPGLCRWMPSGRTHSGFFQSCAVKTTPQKDPFSQCESPQGIRVQVRNRINWYSDNN